MRPALLLALLVPLAACGQAAAPAVAPSQSITLTTDSGEVVVFDEFDLTCNDDTEDELGFDAELLQALSGSYGAVGSHNDPGLLIQIGTGTEGRFALPHDFDWGDETAELVAVFVPRAGKAEELSSSVDEASGTIEVISASCDPEPRLDLRIDASLDSEIGVGKGRAEGHLDLP